MHDDERRVTARRRPGQHIGPQRLWSDDEFARLLRMVEFGYTRPKIAQLLGRHESSVMAKLARHNIRLVGRREPKRHRLQLLLTDTQHAALRKQAGTIPIRTYVLSLLFGKQVRERERASPKASDPG
jgi:hypothetical protein